jgi:hypothetical protein
MKLAFKIDEDKYDIEDGRETVLFSIQMFRDIYQHEHDPLPSLDDFIHKPLSRPDGQMFWVYRQGTFINRSVFEHGGLFAAHTYKAQLDASPEPTFEGYHHVPTLELEAGGKFDLYQRGRFTFNEQRDALRRLYYDMRGGY